MAESASPTLRGGTRAACAACGLELPRGAVVCPSCQTLVHAGELRTLAEQAEGLGRDGDAGQAVITYRRMLELLPRSSKQHDQIAGRIQKLLSVHPSAAQAAQGRAPDWLARLGAVGVLVWKLKGLFVLGLAQGKFLLLGLGQASTLLTMLASFGLYWSLWSWKLAAGLVLSIYVHEMGHVAALRRLGIAATAPMFVPGLGAFIRLKQYPATPYEDALAGLAGPAFGLGAAVSAYAIGMLGNFPMALAVAHFGAWINLFNLIPLGSLDGGRGFRALDRRGRWALAAVMFVASEATGDLMLWVLVLAAAGRAAFEEAPRTGDRKIIALYAFLIVALSALLTLPVPALK